MTLPARKELNRLTVGVQILPPYAGSVKRPLLQKAAHAAFRSAGGRGARTLTVIVTDDAQVRELNRAYRSVDAPTDVLSFGEADGPDGFVASQGEAGYLGDIILSHARATEQAAAYGHPVEEELALLVVHGVLHLLGYDHEQAGDKEEMWALQHTALTHLGIPWQP